MTTKPTPKAPRQKLCCDRLYIFTTCGHTLWVPAPLSPMPSVVSSPEAPLRTTTTTALLSLPATTPSSPTSSHYYSQIDDSSSYYSTASEEDSAGPSTPQRLPSSSPPPERRPRPAHPFQCLRLHTLCLPCRRARQTRLDALESLPVHIDECRWRVSYTSPTADHDAWREWAVAEAKAGGIKEPRRVVDRALEKGSRGPGGGGGGGRGALRGGVASEPRKGGGLLRLKTTAMTVAGGR
jgi:hypothetical protein